MAALTPSSSLQSEFSLVPFARQYLSDTPLVDDPSALETVESEMEHAALSAGRGAQVAISLGEWDSSFRGRLEDLTGQGAAVWAFVLPAQGESLPSIKDVTFIDIDTWKHLPNETFYLVRAVDGSAGITAWNGVTNTGVWSFDADAVGKVWKGLFQAVGLAMPSSPSKKTNYPAAAQALESLAHQFEARNLEFIEHLVHDMKQPIAGLRGTIELLQDQLDRDGQSKSSGLVDQVRGNADFLMRMIDNLLYMQSATAGKLDVQAGSVVLQSVLDQLAALYTGMMNKRQFTLETPSDLHVYADADLLTRVLSNLIANAQKYTHPHTGTIEVRAAREDDQVVIRVTDNGRGIPEAIHDEIFEKYYKSEIVGSERRGFGLGLAFCRVAVEAMNGTINVESDTGKGATFRVVLPTGEAAKTGGS